jgi:hypothetical protein
LDLLHVPGTTLRAAAAGRAPPDLIVFNIGQAEGCLPNDFAHTEGSNPVPGANRITYSALKASFEGIAAVGLDDVYNLFVGRYCLHGLPFPLYNEISFRSSYSEF